MESPSAIVPTGLIHLAKAHRVMEAILFSYAFENFPFVTMAPMVVLLFGNVFFPVNKSVGTNNW